MKIEISEKEYRLLIDIFEMADWVLFSHRTDMPEETRGYRDLQQKFYGLCTEMGAGDLIGYDTELGEYAPTEAFDEQSDYMSFVEEYENAFFWDELITRLADRDLLRQEGPEGLQQMSIPDKIEKVVRIEEKYAREFEEQGLDTLEIPGGFGRPKGKR